MGRWRTMRTIGGAVVKSGLNPRRRDEMPRHRPHDAPHQAVVLRSYVHDDPDNTRRFHRVTSDVILVNSQLALFRVPVLQRNYGVHNIHGLWVPRGTSRDLEGGELLLRPVSRNGTRRGDPTPMDRLDGDQVLVDYVEGDLDMPVIIGAYDHGRSNRQIVTEAGTPVHGEPQATEYYVHHNGTEIRINETGDMLIDLLEAYGTDEDEDAANGQGDLRIRVKSDRSVTIEVNGTDVLEVFEDGGQVRVDLGAGADEQLVLGNQLSNFIRDEIATKVNNFWTLIFNTHTHTVPMGGSTGAPAVAQTETIANLPPEALSDLAKTKKM